MKQQEKIRCSVGVTAYDEEKNIGQLLTALCTQLLREVEITEIIVIASGCTDRTEEIVREHAQEDKRIQLLTQPEREGKTSAVNLFLQHAQEEICVVESGDTLPAEDCLEHLVRMFADLHVGMTGAQKVAVNTPDHVVEYLSYLRLQLEHELCLEIPRLGELIAFRKVFDHIPLDVSMDEAFVEALVIQGGMQVRYAPDAIVYNMGPTTLSDFIRQRRRNHAGHLHLKRKYGYRVSSLDTRRVLKVAGGMVWGAVRMVAILGALAVLEGVARVLGYYDYYVQGKRYEKWPIAWTTKKVEAERAKQAHPRV